MPLRVLVVDDEGPARRKVLRLLAADPRFVGVGEAEDGLSGLKAVDALAPDVVIVDVQMPVMTGIEMVEALDGAHPPLVVFATAHEQHALRAFEVDAVDYLLKPFDAARMARAMAKVARTAREAAPSTSIPSARRERIAFRVAGGWEAFLFSDILRLSANGKYVEVFTRNAGAISIRASLSSVACRLPAEEFVRTHRGEIVLASAVARIETVGHGDAVASLIDGSSVIVSRSHRAAVQAAVGAHRSGTSRAAALEPSTQHTRPPNDAHEP